ncbi:MAG: hypothetical protein IPM99_17195 [Rubrivivax sp.]|jgi:hypothetical protein|nr:hypothetical protein [Rubrivivax sp.]
MPNPTKVRRSVVATVQEVLPQMGLAYATDHDDRQWGITRCTQGGTLDGLQQGTRVTLTIEDHGPFEVASGWAPLT